MREENFAWRGATIGRAISAKAHVLRAERGAKRRKGA